jgi:hypothetical protein
MLLSHQTKQEQPCTYNESHKQTSFGKDVMQQRKAVKLKVAYYTTEIHSIPKIVSFIVNNVVKNSKLRKYKKGWVTYRRKVA